MATKFYDLVRVYTATTGTGTITLGTAVPGFQTFAAVTDGVTVSYAIEEGANREVGHGVYSASAGTLTRTPLVSTAGANGPITLAGSAQVAITLAAEDLMLANLLDVNASAPSNGQVLAWSNTDSKWEPATVSGGGSGSTTLAALTDVSIASPTDGQLLAYRTADSKWEHSDLYLTASATKYTQVKLTLNGPGQWGIYALAALSLSTAAGVATPSGISANSDYNARSDITSQAVSILIASPDTSHGWSSANLTDVEIVLTYASAIAPTSVNVTPIVSTHAACAPAGATIYGSLDSGATWVEIGTSTFTGETGGVLSNEVIVPVSTTISMSRPNDVDHTVSPATGDVLIWNDSTGKWVPSPTAFAQYATLWTAPPALASFTTLNSASAVQNADNSISVTGVPTGNNVQAYQGIYKAAPGTPYRIRALIKPQLIWAANNYCCVGIGFTDGTKLQVVSLGTTGMAPNLGVANWDSVTSFNSNVGTNVPMPVPDTLWLEIADDGTTVYFQYSYDGYNFIPLYSVAKSAGFLGSGGYTNVGVLLNTYTTSAYDGIPVGGVVLSWNQALIAP